MTTRFGIDVGGTFTDLIYLDQVTGELVVAKTDTTIDAPERGVIEAAGSAIPDAGLRAAEYFLHGTTVGLNSLLTRTGAKVGLLCTRGFRDVLNIRRGDREAPWNLLCDEPEPLVPRRLSLPIAERMRFDGTEHQPLDENDVRAAAATFAGEGVDSVAIAFLHAYANPVHELRAAEVLREAGFAGQISLSHQVTGEYREYERTSTTVIDAYVRPRMTGYLQALESGLRDKGFGGSMLLTRSGGGAFTFRQAEDRPFETIMSGPVAGAEGAAELARELNLGDVITADVGGTSFDTSLITGGRPQLRHEGQIEGMVVQSPWVDVRSIGAGGGSIAWVDLGGLLQVGPQSAGSVPGPAAYGQGGTQPTVTDAALVLGMLGSGVLAGGRRQLDRDAAVRAFEPVASRLRLTVEQVARGTMTIAAVAMANAIREITVEQGIDPRECRLMPFGGAGPLFATLLAEELEIKDVLVPAYAGNFSAWSLLSADLTQVASRTRIVPLTREGAIDEVNAVAAELFEALEARQDLAASAQTERQVRVDVRYMGQEHAITVALPGDASGRTTTDAADVRARFVDDYERTFAHTMDEQAEVVSVRATLRTPLPKRSGAAGNGGGAMPAGETEIEAYSFTAGETRRFAILDRSTITAPVDGPAIVIEPTATTYVDVGYEMTPGDFGALRLHKKGAN